MRLKLSRYVESDLRLIAEYIARDNPERAVTFIRELRGTFSGIAERPRTYQLRPDLGAEVRIAPFGRYVVVFRITQRGVRIERVLHGARDLPAHLR